MFLNVFCFHYFSIFNVKSKQTSNITNCLEPGLRQALNFFECEKVFCYEIAVLLCIFLAYSEFQNACLQNQHI